jgi:hypothetical protein
MPDVIWLLQPVLDETKVNLLIDDWLAARDHAADLLVDTLSLESPREILMPQHRGRHPLADTGWVYRTHGIGVDVTRSNGHGGVDFDFTLGDDNVFADPDWWRLHLFAKRAVHDKTVDTARYADIIDAIDDQSGFVQFVIAARFGSR